MAYQQIPGTGLWLPGHPYQWPTAAPAFTSSIVDAAAEKSAFCGQVFFKSRTSTKNISKVHFRWGTVVKSNGPSTVKVSLQNVLTTGVTLMVPDETVDENVTIANADATYASNTWCTATLGASRTVSFGDYLAVVWEYVAFGAGDTFGISGMTAGALYGGAVSTNKVGAPAWAFVGSVPNVVLEFDDGTFGTLDGAIPAKAFNAHIFNSGSSPNEYAMEFQFPFPCKVDAAGILAENNATSTATWQLILYDGTTPMTNGTLSSGAYAQNVSTPRFWGGTFPGEVILAANTVYRLSFKPGTATSWTIYSFDVNAVGHLDAHPGGSNFSYATRAGGAWTSTSTRRPFMAIRVSSLDDGAGGGGGTADYKLAFAEPLVVV